MRRRRFIFLQLSVMFFLALALAFNAQAVRTIFYDGFESGLSGWLVGDNDTGGTPAYWGVVNSAFGGEGAHNGANKAYCAAVGYAGTAAAPIYPNYMLAYMLRTIDLTSATNATLSFWFKIPTIDTPYDYCTVFIDDIRVWTTDAKQTVWTQVTLSLERFIGGAHALRFEFSSDNTGTGEGWYLDDVLVSDAFTPGPPPDNDNFSGAQVLPGATGSVSGSTANATPESGEPTGGFAATNSVWFRWTAVTNAQVTFRTGGNLGTFLCIYSGSTLASLTPVACANNSDTNNTSPITFNAVAGVVYRISVRGANNARGSFQLSWDQPAGIGSDLLPDIMLWADASQGYLYGWYIDKNEPTQPGRTLLRVSTATVNKGTGPLELIGSSTTPGVYQRIYRTDGSYYDRYAGTFTFHPSHGHLHFDNWLNFHLRAVLPGNGVGDIVVAGDKTSFAIIDLDPYDLTLPGAPATNHYQGGLLQGISVGWSDAYGASLPDQWIDVTGVAPGEYWLEAVVDPANSVLELTKTNNVGRILVDLTLLGANSVTNDFFANPTVITGVTAGIRGANVNATKEAGEPVLVTGSSGGASVWYRWTAPSNMPVEITTDGSSFDTVLAVFTGSSISALTKVASDDDGGLDKASRVTFNATAGTTYRIAVDGYTGQTGNLDLNFNPAWNDNLDRCVTIAGFSGIASGSTRGATRQSGEPLHGNVNGTNSIWYCWTAPTNGPFTFDTSGSDFDTLLAVYTGTAFPLNLVGADDNSGLFNGSRFTFQAVSNTTYRIAVDGANGASGVVQLGWNGPTGPAIVSQPRSTNLVAGSTAQFNVGVSGSPSLSFQWRHFETNIVHDGGGISGATSATLTLGKIVASQAGGYSVVITNAYGAVTSAPANLIVLDNPRVVYVEQLTGPIGGVAVAPVKMQAVGDEHALDFSLLFDASVLSNPRVTAGSDTASANISMGTDLAGSGKVGVILTLPPGQVMAAGSTRELARILFDVNSAASAGSVTPLGFADQPITKAISTTNDLALTALFAAGSIRLERVVAVVQGQRLANGNFQISLNGLAGRNYAIETTTNLTTLQWQALTTNQTTLEGLLQFVEQQTTNSPQRFYRTRLVP